MNGLQAIELMKQDKIIKSGIYLYRLRNGIFEYNTDLGIVNGADWRLENGFDLNSNDYKEYVEQNSLTGWERVDEGIEKYFLQSGGYVMADIEGNIWFDDDYYEIANYFSKKEKAEEVHFKQTLFRKLQRFSDENDGDKIDWNSGIQGKYHIYFDYFSKELKVQSYSECRDLFQVYFISEEVTKKAIELFHDELIKYFKGEY